MAAAQPRSRVTARREPGRLLIVVRPRRSLGLPVFLAVWLAGWAAGEWDAIRAVLGGAPAGAGTLLAVLWLVGWTVGGLVTTAVLAWLVAGREELTVDGRALAVRQAIGALGATRRYDVAAIRDLREALRGEEDGPGAGTISFAHAGARVAICAGLEGDDVQRVLALLRERLAADGGSGWGSRSGATRREQRP